MTRWTDAEFAAYQARQRGPVTALPVRWAPFDDPQSVLRTWLDERWPGIWQENYCALVARKYELDFADTTTQIGIEVDGWEFHGKHKAGFARDRAKDRLLTLAGWAVLRFTAKEILHEMPDVLATIHALRQRRQGAAMDEQELFDERDVIQGIIEQGRSSAQVIDLCTQLVNLAVHASIADLRDCRPHLEQAIAALTIGLPEESRRDDADEKKRANSGA